MKTITRQKAVQKILHSGGKFFSVCWKTNKGTKFLNGQFKHPPDYRRNEDKIYGYLTVSMPKKKKGYRRVDTRNISSLNIGGQKYKVK